MPRVLRASRARRYVEPKQDFNFGFSEKPLGVPDSMRGSGSRVLQGDQSVSIEALASAASRYYSNHRR
jgi:hypothetical protein